MLHQSWILPDPDDCVVLHAPVHKEVAVPAREGVDDVLGGLAEGGAVLVSAAKALHKADADRGIVSDVEARREAVQEAGRAVADPQRKQRKHDPTSASFKGAATSKFDLICYGCFFLAALWLPQPLII